MSNPLTPKQRSMYAQLAALSRWSGEDPVVGTEKAREAFMARFERQVDPNNELAVDERARRAEAARKAHFTRLGIASARARAARKAARSKAAA